MNTFKGESINQTDSVEVYGKIETYDLDKGCDRNSDTRLIYFYRLPKMPEHGIKIGMTTCHPGQVFWEAIKRRIDAQENELALEPFEYDKYGSEREVIHWGVALDASNEDFKDYYVHAAIARAVPGNVLKEREWFLNLTPEKAVSIFEDARKPIIKTIYKPRQEQTECVEAMHEYFTKHPKGGRFLLNCKMRFGKCFTTYKFCEEEGLDRILILTFVPAVEESWRADLGHIEKDYEYFTDYDLRKSGFDPASVDRPYVMFLSLQNYLGKDSDSGDVKAKIEKLRKVEWDLIVLDEYHFGAWNTRTRRTLNEGERLEDLDPTYQDKISRKTGIEIVDSFKIRTARTICLSGTPFKAIAKGEFNANSSYTYSYFHEQKNKYPDDDDKSVINPVYEEFPDMKIFGYNMGGLIRSDAYCRKDPLLKKDFFSLNEFFKAEPDVNYTRENRFVNEADVLLWIETIKGAFPRMHAPYGDPAMKGNLKDTLWLMPTVAGCAAMTRLLKADAFFSRYEIVNLSAPEVGAGVAAFNRLNDALAGYPAEGKVGSIAITVNKLTLGVTVKPWASVFVLKDLASPEQYFQSIFRIQTPYVRDGKILKREGYVFDYNIDRAAALLLKYAEQSEKDPGHREKMNIAKLIVRYLPIYVNGKTSEPISEDVFYQLAYLGDTSGESLSKRITDLKRTTRVLDDKTIAEMLNDPEVTDIIKRVFAHAKFNHNKDSKVPPDVDPGNRSLESDQGRRKGYDKGLELYEGFTNLDEDEIQEEFEGTVAKLIKETMPRDYGKEQAIRYTNGFTEGFDKGINAPIRKLKCGKDDGEKFVERVREHFGRDVQYGDESKRLIDNFVTAYLNTRENIPPAYQGAVYRRWYCESFKHAVRTRLSPPKKAKDGESTDDAENVLRHILARLFEFLYISVYRETCFKEIFANADPDVFLAAVGITKEDFEVLNKYKVFEEQTLNNYIRDFFENENLGKTLDLSDPEVKKNYRNSFDWFGYGIKERIHSEPRVKDGSAGAPKRKVKPGRNRGCKTRAARFNRGSGRRRPRGPPAPSSSRPPRRSPARGPP